MSNELISLHSVDAKVRLTSRRRLGTAARIRRSFSLSALNSFRLSSRASHYMTSEKRDEISYGLEFAAGHELPLVPLGEATNVILPPILQALCLHIRLKGIEVVRLWKEELLLQAEAGENWHELVRHCMEHGYYGLENMALIPGNVGAAPIQNIGAYGAEIKDFIFSLDAMEISSGKTRRFHAEDCDFSYRSSKFQTAWRDKFIILAVVFRLSRKAKANFRYDSLHQELRRTGIRKPHPRDIFTAICRLRRARFPSRIGNVGSFFHNPSVSAAHFNRLKQDFPALIGFPLSDHKVRVAAGSLMEQCGWKGFMDGRVGISPRHALCLINGGGAAQRDVLKLARAILLDVKKRSGISLTIEPRIY